MNEPRSANSPDLRSTGIHRDHWYPVARSKALKAGKTLAVAFAGEPVVLVRTAAGALFALEDRCAHRQVPLSAGTVCGDSLKCGYHGWSYAASGRCVDVPYLGKGETRPNGVRGYPVREAYGLLFLFPGDAAKADGRFPMIAAHADRSYKTRYLDREINCHYSFMHENLMDMNHQFLHRRLMGGIRTVLVKFTSGPDWVEAVYRFDRVSGAQSLGEKFIIATGDDKVKKREHDLMTIRTQYPYQTLTFVSAEDDKPALDLWLSYAPTDKAQKANHSMGLMMIRKPSLPGLIHVLWPFIVLFTDAIFKQDREIVELEQKAHDAQGGDWNQEIFPVIREVRDVLIRQGVPLLTDVKS